MKRLGCAILVSALGLAVVTPDAVACGEVLFHCGYGMRYHAFMTRHPANILVYSSETIEPGSARGLLYTGLRQAGHKVTVVTNGNGLVGELAAHHFDVIIANARDMDAIESSLAKSGGGPALMAVVGPDTTGQGRFPISVQEGAGLNSYLKLIDRTTRPRGI